MSAKINSNNQTSINISPLPLGELNSNSKSIVKNSDQNAVNNLNQKLANAKSSDRTSTQVDKTAEVKPETFKTNGGEWRTRDNVANDTPRFYRNGELTFDTKRVDTEFYKDDKTNQWVRLNGNGSLYNSPAYNGKEKPADVSDFQWQGWKVVAESQVPADYSTQGKTITLTAAENADPQSALRNYIKQNVIADGWTNDAATDEQAIKRANELGIKVEAEKIGVNEKGEPLYIVKISDEDLAKLRQVKAEWKKEKYEKLPTTTDDSKNEVNKISQDVGGLFYETGRKVIDSVVNGIPDFMNTFFAGDPKPASRDIPSYGRAKLGNYDELANRSGEINVPRIPTTKVLPKYEFKSRWSRRDINGVVDGDSFKLGETTSTVTSILAPIIVGKVFTPPTSPQSLKTLGGIPEVEAATITKAPKVKTTAEVIDERYDNISKNGHAVQRHGEKLTKQQLDDRAMHGKDPITGTTDDAYNKFPDGTPKKHGYGKNATKFTSKEALVKAETYVKNTQAYKYALQEAVVDGQPRFEVTGVKLKDIYGTNYKDQVFGKTRTGSRKNPTGVNQTDFTDGTVTAVFKKDAKGNWNIHTMYPEPK